jgi:hypothetical protein
VRWLPACEGVSPGARDHPLLEAVTMQWVKTVCNNICRVKSRNPITSPKPSSHTVT